MGKITLALIGAGGRGNNYANYALLFPHEVQFTAVAEPKKYLRDEFVRNHSIPADKAFETWEHLLQHPPLADGLLICTQDSMHYENTIAAIERGYKYILLEKPIAPTPQECLDIAKKASEKGVVIQICHSLRYTPFFRQIKTLLDAGTIGKIMSINLTESVGYYHYSHSYVRGDWADSEKSSPMILAKSCHDMDILVYLTRKKCKNISSYGSLTHFTAANCPEGAPKRCTDGCSYREACPFYAPRIYMKWPDFKYHACEKEGFSDLSEALQTGRFGRCVYQCDNNVVDHQTVNILLEDDITATFSMSAFTEENNRRLTIMGTKGEIKGSLDENLISVFDFASGLKSQYAVNPPSAGHSGADEIMMQDFVDLINRKNNNCCMSSIDESVHSHLMAFAAEKSRLEHVTIDMQNIKPILEV